MRTIPQALAVAVLLATGSPAPAQTSQAPSVYWGHETADARQIEQQHASKRGSMGVAARAMVATCHRRSADIGLAILRRGGTAADAFIAATFADYVLSPGASSLGGPLAALVYDAKRDVVESLTAPLKTVADPDGQWRLGGSAPGTQVLVPGALAGLEQLHRRRGRLPWRDLVAPAQRLAAEGFVLDAVYAAILAAYKTTATRTVYGRTTFAHPDGRLLAAGDTLKQPALAATLQAIARRGSAYVYDGPWTAEAVREIAARGGRASRADFAGYRATWATPLRVDYRGYRVYGPSAHDSGGARLLLALEVLEHTDIVARGHYAESLDGLETLIRVARAVGAEPQLYAHAFFDDPGRVQALLDGDRSGAIWKEVEAKIDRAATPSVGTHSYSLVVVDASGNTVAGTHTIESLPFGSGIFVGGVPLNDTGLQHPWTAGAASSTPPGTYLVEPMSAVLAFRGRQLVLASSTFSASLWPADLQLVVSALDFDWTPERIALTPRFGGYVIDLGTMTADISTLTIDKRYTAETLRQLAARGVRLSQAGYVDTGMLVIVKRDPKTGALTGFTPEQLPDGKAAGY